MDMFLQEVIEDIQKAGSVVLEGTDVADAEGGAYQDSSTSSQKYAVSLTLTRNGKTKFAEATKANVGKQIAIVYDDQVLSAPNVNEEISGGKAQINRNGKYRRGTESCFLHKNRFLKS